MDVARIKGERVPSSRLTPGVFEAWRYGQMAVAVLGLMTSFVLIQRQEEGQPPLSRLVVRGLPVHMAFGFVILAPGNFACQAGSSGEGALVEQAVPNLARVGELIAGSSSGMLVWILMLVCVVLLAWDNLPQEAHRGRFQVLAGVAAAGVLSTVLPAVALLGTGGVWAMLLLRRCREAPEAAVVAGLLTGFLPRWRCCSWRRVFPVARCLPSMP